MKRTLLFFLILLPSLFYAQISSIIHCAGDNTFDLTSRTEELTKDRRPSETYTIRYFLKYSDPTKGHEILNPQNYVCTESSQQIFANVEGAGPSVSYSFMIIVNSPIEFAYAGISNPVCGNTRVTMTARGGKSPYKFSLDGVNYISENVFNEVAPGSYTLYIKDDYGCIVTSTKVIDPVYPLTATALQINNSCFRSNDGRIEVNAAGGKLPYTFSIGNGDQGSNIFYNLIAGNYTVKVADASGCNYTFPVTISEPSALLSVPVIADVSAVGGNDGEITVSTWGGTPPYSYILRNNVGAVLKPFQDSNKFSALEAGTYNIEVRDAKSCIYIHSNIKVLAPSPLAATATSSATNCVNQTGTITVTATGGKSPYQFSLNNEESFTSSNVFSNVTAGNYLIIVRDSDNIKTTAFVTVNAAQPVLITSEIVSEISCNGAKDGVIKATVIQGQPPYTYAFDNGNFQPNDTFRNISAGTHTIRVLDKNNCTSEVSVTLLEPTILKSTVTVNGNTITASTIDGTAPYSYILQNNIGFNTGPQTSETFSNLQPGIYNLQIIDARGCSLLRNDITISESTLLSATATITPVSCENPRGTITVNATGGSGSYEYSLDNNSNYSASNVFSDLFPGRYTINVKDSQNAITTITATIIPLNPLIAAATLTKTIDCVSNASITITANGGNEPYQYSLDNGKTYTSNRVFTNVSAGTYFVSVKDSLDCIAITNSIIIEQSVPLTATVDYTKITDCSVPISHVVINTTGGQAPYQYSLNKLPYQSNHFYSGAYPGNYILDVKDANGCIFTTTFVIESPVSFTTTATVTPALNCGDNDTVTITAMGGQAPYTYSFDGLNTFSSTNTSNSLTAGTHMLHAKDSSGCYATLYITITSPIVSAITISTSTTSTSPNNNDGSIIVNATGGTGPYSYAITDSSGLQIIPFQTSNVFTGLKAGTYSVQVKDAKGCFSIQTNITVLNNPNSLLITVNTTSATCANPIGILTVHASGGLVPYQYSLDGVNYVSSNTFNLTPGTYTITVRDADRNLNSIIAVLDQISTPTVLANVISNVGCKGDNTGTITAVAAAGKAPYTYSLDGITFSTTNTFSNLRVGTYNITVKDYNGCMATTAIVVTEPVEGLSATAISINDQGVIITAKGGTAPYFYSLQNKNGIVVAGPQDNGIFRKLPVGLYGAQVTDANGCGYIQSGVSIIQSPPLSATVDILSINCTNPGTITVNATGGFQPYQYSYDNGTTYTISNTYSSFKPGNYAIKVRDSENTIVSFSAVLTTGSLPSINVISITNVNCKGQADGSFTVETTGGKAPYTYSLDQGSYIVSSNNNFTFANLRAGTHFITVKDVNGCAVVAQVNILEPILPLVSVTTVKNQTITINASGGTGSIKYAISPDLDKFSTNNVFSALALGSYTILIMDANGCFITTEILVDPPAPLINGQNKLILDFKPGQTLADLTVDGQNIKWYINQNPLTGKTNKTNETPLPLTTVLVDGTTYYASQTINGIESTERLAVTAKSNGALSTPDFVLPNFKYYPNPVKHLLTINNTSVIDEIEIYSVSGASILSKRIDNDHAEIDLSNVSSGFYFLKVKAEGQVKIVKLVKK